jgi:hypothetical protein
MSPRISFHENGQSVHKKGSPQKTRHYKALWVETIMPEVINCEKWNLNVEGVLQGRTPKEVMKYESMRHIGRPRKRWMDASEQNRLIEVHRGGRGGKIRRNGVRFMAQGTIGQSVAAVPSGPSWTPSPLSELKKPLLGSGFQLRTFPFFWVSEIRGKIITATLTQLLQYGDIW